MTKNLIVNSIEVSQRIRAQKNALSQVRSFNKTALDVIKHSHSIYRWPVILLENFNGFFTRFYNHSCNNDVILYF